MFSRDFTAVPERPGIPGYYGLDGKFVKTLIDKMNITPNYIYPRDGHTFGITLGNGTSTGSLGDVVRKDCHLAGNSRYVTKLTTDIEFTDFLYSEKLSIVIPKRPEIPKYLIILRVFKLSTWLLIIFVVVLCAGIIYLKNVSLTSSTSSNTSILFAFGLLIGEPIRFNRSNQQYIFIFCYLFFSLVIIGLIQGVLTKQLSTINYDKDINTLEELANSPHRILSSSLDELNIEYTDVVGKLVTQEIFGYKYATLKWFYALQYMCDHKNISLLGRESEIDYVKYNVFLSPDGTRCLHTVREPILSYSLGYILPKQSPFLYKLNGLIGKLREFGFIMVWIKRAFSRKSQVPVEVSFRRITLVDFAIPFCILFLGYTLAFLVFIFEILFKRCQQS